MKPNPVTMRDVAKAAGVSRMTVSRALRKDSPVSDETRQRILQVVRDMNYVPDQMAGSLSTKRSGFVAVLVPSLNNLHFAETVQALTEALAPSGRQILLGHTGYSAEREEALIEEMLRRRPEAIVLSYDGHTDRTLDLLGDARVPVVELWETPEEPICHTVGFSNLTAARAMTDSLIAQGYRNIAFLGEAKDDWTRGAARRSGYLESMQAKGLSAHRCLQYGSPPLSIEDGAAAVGLLLARFPDTDCIFCVSDAPAFGAMSRLRERGIDVPEHIGIAGFGNFEVSRFSQPAISTVVVDPIRIGQETGHLIAGCLDEASTLTGTVKIRVPAEVSLRDSTRTRFLD
ncbi:MAG: LacI family DNA-binding transcriptional regulator [Pseudomonadota bacterium]